METRAFTVVLLVAFVCVQKCTLDATIGIYCWDVVYCKLIKGDIARESEKYGKNSTKYYNEAEDFYEKYILKKNGSETECQKSHDACIDEAAKMAIDGLNFLSKYRKGCNYRSYSRTVFDCKNIKNWPTKLRSVLPLQGKNCRADCIIIDEKPLTLTTGKIVNSKNMGALSSGDAEIDKAELESKPASAKRTVAKMISGLDDNTNGTEWGMLEKCPENTWVIGVDRIDVGDYLYYISMPCSAVKTADQSEMYLESTVVGNKPPLNTKWPSEYKKAWSPLCKNSYVVGASFNFGNFRKYTGKALIYINYLCANNNGTPTWHYPRRSKDGGRDHKEKADSKEMVCPNGTAVCALQTKSDTFENIRFLTNLRIGCCNGDVEHVELFVSKGNATQPTTPPPQKLSDAFVELYNLQTRLKFLFWDQVLNKMILQYQQLYSPFTIAGEKDWVRTECQNGTFVNGFSISDPRSGYFMSKRILQISFQCGAPNGSRVNNLNLYGRLSKDHALTDGSPIGSDNECNKGYYTTAQLTYFTDKQRRCLVNAWEFGMKCSVSGETHKTLINSSIKNNISEQFLDKATVECKTESAVCGFETKLADQRRGALEGFFFKVLCCKI